jgi:hypothetical protein
MVRFLATTTSGGGDRASLNGPNSRKRPLLFVVNYSSDF